MGDAVVTSQWAPRFWCAEPLDDGTKLLRLCKHKPGGASDLFLVKRRRQFAIRWPMRGRRLLRRPVITHCWTILGASLRVAYQYRIRVRAVQPIPSAAVDAVTVALIVAAITGGAGIVQGLVQGALTSRSASVSARQEAARAAIELCDRLAEHVADAAQAANEYGLELTDEFLKDWEAREPLVRRILTADGRAFAALAALPADSAARRPVKQALAVITALPSVGQATELNAAWARGRHAIPEALEAIGQERAFQYRQLEASARTPWARRAVRRTKPAVEG